MKKLLRERSNGRLYRADKRGGAGEFVKLLQAGQVEMLSRHALMFHCFFGEFSEADVELLSTEVSPGP